MDALGLIALSGGGSGGGGGSRKIYKHYLRLYGYDATEHTFGGIVEIYNNSNTPITLSEFIALITNNQTTNFYFITGYLHWGTNAILAYMKYYNSTKFELYSYDIVNTNMNPSISQFLYTDLKYLEDTVAEL